jgi:NAD(P)H-nitrite reductase large subunit
MKLKNGAEVIIIGGGVAGTTTAETLCKLRPDLNLTIIERENHPLYSRVLLPHFIQEKIPLEKVFLKALNWYHDNKIEFMSGVQVEKIDSNNNFVLTSEGRELPYDALIVCAGGDVRLIESDARGIAYLRTLDDAHHVKALINEAKNNNATALAYGGGFIALEFVNAFKKHELKTILAMRGNGFWTSSMTTEISSLLEMELARHEVDLHKNTTIDLESNLSTLKLKGEKIENVGVVGVGIGIDVDNQLIKSAGITIKKGIVTNEYLETNIPNIFAVGDIAEFYDPVTETHLMTGNWLSAILQARSLSNNLATGEKKPFSAVTSYATKLLDLDLVFIGDTNIQNSEIKSKIQNDKEGIQLFTRNGRTVGAILLGNVKDRMKITQAIQDKKLYDI